MIPDRWLKVVVPLPEGEAGVAAFIELLVAEGARSVEEEQNSLVTYFPAPDDPHRFTEELGRTLARSGVPSDGIRWSWQPHRHWVELWKQGLGAREIGTRLLVTPTWVEVDDPGNREVIRIDPGLAFGTAEHATTRLCLVHLERTVRGAERVLDIGAGSGILSIAAVRLGASSALAVEMDAMACAAARDNVWRNGVDDRVRIEERAVPVGSGFGYGGFDIVVANMVSGLLIPRLDGLADALDSGGTLVIGGVLEEEADSFVAAARAAGLCLLSDRAETGWWSGRFERPDMGGPIVPSADSA